MEKKTWLARHWMALAALLVVGLLPFLPFFASGGALYASDALGAPAWKFYFDALRQGSIPMWLPYSFGGMPTFDAGFGDGSYPLFLLIGALLPIKVFISYAFIVHVLIAGVNAYILVSRYFGLGRVLSLALAAAYMLNTNFISHIHAGHTGKFFIMSWLPLSLYLLLRNLSAKGKWYHAGLFALSLSLMLSTFHPQFAYYVLMGFFLVWAFKCFWLLKERRFAGALGLALRFWLPVFCGIGLVFFLFYPPMQYTKHYGIRGSGEKTTFEHATSWSMHPEETASLIVPEFGGINEKYWGRNPFKLNAEYPGLSVLFLGIMGFAFFFREKRRWMWLWGGVSLLAVIFGLGAHTPLFRLFYAFVPGIKNFRAPSMMLFWLATALLMMSADALSRLSDPKGLSADRRKLLGKRLWQAGFAVSGLFLLAGIAPDAFLGLWDGLFGAEGPSNIANRAGNHSAFALGALRSGVLLAVLIYTARKWLLDGNEPLRFGLVLLVVTAVDLMWVDANFIKVYDPDRMLPDQPAIAFLKQDTASQRVFGLPGAYERWVMQYNLIETADGWTDNEYRLYREYRGNDYQNNPNLMAGLKQNPDGSVSGSPFLDMLNVGHLAYRLQGDGTLRLAPNASVLPRAWFVPGWETGSDTLALEKMKAPGFNPRALAYVSSTTPLPEGFAASQIAPPPGVSQPSDAVAAPLAAAPAVDTAKPADSAAAPLAAQTSSPKAVASPAGITRVSATYNRQTYKVETDKAGIFILSELWFPHWRLTVDGKPATLLRADFAFRGAALTPGTHEVSISYESPWIRKGFAVAGISLVVLAGGLFGIARFGRLGLGKDAAV